MANKVVETLRHEFDKHLDKMATGIGNNNWGILKTGANSMNQFLAAIELVDDASEPLKTALGNLLEKSSQIVKEVKKQDAYSEIVDNIASDIRKTRKGRYTPELQQKIALAARYTGPIEWEFNKFLTEVENFSKEKELQEQQQQHLEKRPVLSRYNANISLSSSHASQAKVDVSKITRSNQSHIDHRLNQHESQQPVQTNIPEKKVSNLKGAWEAKIEQQRLEAEKSRYTSR